jgi:tRNA modification GTPase
LLTNEQDETIVALSTPAGVGAIGVIRVSGREAFSITQKIFKGKNLAQQATHTVHFGYIMDGQVVVDEVVVAIFKEPNSFTKENIVEISCHGSQFILQKVIKLLIRKGCRYAKPGEFTQRAFLNGRFDLAQAEAVADVIAADSEVAHFTAMNQMRGGFSNEIKNLREKLVNFASLIELELDFSEEDVEFANRDDLKKLIYTIQKVLSPLIDSFDSGNAIKSGIATVIAGKPNAGKSTLLNALLNEEKAIVSDIAGTTRDVIEDEIAIEGIKFRFIDTAGLRQTEDKLEAIGIERTRQKLKEAGLIIYLIDATQSINNQSLDEIRQIINSQIPILLIANKVDKITNVEKTDLENKLSILGKNLLFISAAQKNGISQLKSKLLETVNLDNFKSGNATVTNIRHYESLIHTQEALENVLNGLDANITGDFLALEIRQALHHLGLITGEVTNDEILGNIFSKFCIGK